MPQPLNPGLGYLAWQKGLGRCDQLATLNWEMIQVTQAGRYKHRTP